MNKDRPLVIAHRGYSSAAPENTIPAFEQALAAQADMVELDCLQSRDGVPVVFHDRMLDRTTNAVARWGGKNLRLDSRTMEELRRLDAGGWFSPRFARERIPTLEEALDVIQRKSVTLIERKECDAKTLIELLRKKELLNEVRIQAFDWRFLAECRELSPNVPLGALGPPAHNDGSRSPDAEPYLNSDFLDGIEESGATVVGWNRRVTRDSVLEVHERGLKVWIYTINDPDTALELLEMGVDGIITDNPPMVWKALALWAGGWER